MNCIGQPSKGDVPDVVGLTLEEALEKLREAGIENVELVETEPPNRPRKSDVTRVIAQRVDGGRAKLIVSKEAYIQPYRCVGRQQK